MVPGKKVDAIIALEIFGTIPNIKFFLGVDKIYENFLFFFIKVRFC